MEVRKYRAEDLGPLARLGSLAFGGKPSDWEEYYTPEKNPRMDLEGVHVIEEDGEVRASATVLSLEVFVGGEPVPMGGVAAVKTHPAYRRRGYAGELMRTILHEMREQNVHLSMLWPFAHAFYRAHGWELAGETIKYTLEPADLPTSPEQKHIRAYWEEDLPRLMELFEQKAKLHSCCVRRPGKAWRRQGLFGKEDQIAVYERDGEIEGYLIYHMSDRKEARTPPRTLDAREMVAVTARARTALLSFLAAQDPLAFEIRHETPRGKPLHPYLRSSYVKAEIEPEFMLRLVDVEGALGLLRRRIEPPLVLEVSDDVIPENEGEYTVGEGVRRGAHSEYRVALDVRRLAQLYTGYLPADQLAERGLVEPSSCDALDLLAALFPPEDPWVSSPDHF